MMEIHPILPNFVFSSVDVSACSTAIIVIPTLLRRFPSLNSDTFYAESHVFHQVMALFHDPLFTSQK